MNDIIVDPKDNNDLVVHQGDFFIGPSEMQHIGHIVEAEPGHYKSSPMLGVGIRKYLNGFIDASVKRKIQLQVSADGIKIRRINYESGILEIKI